MMLGREVSQPLDIMLGTVNEKEKEPAPYLKNLGDTLQEVHSLARENLQRAQRRQKKDYDVKTNQQLYNVGDVVLKTNSATKVGQSRKLKQPWRGPYIIIDVKSPVLYKIKDRKTESVIHHDRIKQYRAPELPGWLKRIRNELMKNVATPQENDMIQDIENQVSDLAWLFEQNDTSVSDVLTQTFREDTESDPLTQNPGDDDNLVSDNLMLAGFTESDSLTSVQKPTLRSLEDLSKMDGDLDQTFIYDIQNVQDQTSVSREKRVHRRPVHLADYDLQTWEHE